MVNSLRFILTLGLVLLPASCGILGPRIDIKSLCATTCDTWREHGCIEGDDSPGGRSCEDVCDAAEALDSVPHECIQAANSCEQARECEL